MKRKRKWQCFVHFIGTLYPFIWVTLHRKNADVCTILPRKCWRDVGEIWSKKCQFFRKNADVTRVKFDRKNADVTRVKCDPTRRDVGTIWSEKCWRGYKFLRLHRKIIYGDFNGQNSTKIDKNRKMVNGKRWNPTRHTVTWKMLTYCDNLAGKRPNW